MRTSVIHRKTHSFGNSLANVSLLITLDTLRHPFQEPLLLLSKRYRRWRLMVGVLIVGTLGGIAWCFVTCVASWVFPALEAAVIATLRGITLAVPILLVCTCVFPTEDGRGLDHRVFDQISRSIQGWSEEVLNPL